MDPMENTQNNSNSYVQPTVEYRQNNGIIPPNMASADEDSGIKPEPALTPTAGIAGHIPGDDFPQFFHGQNSPPGAVVGVKDTPPPYRIIHILICSISTNMRSHKIIHTTFFIVIVSAIQSFTQIDITTYIYTVMAKNS